MIKFETRIGRNRPGKRPDAIAPDGRSAQRRCEAAAVNGEFPNLLT